METQKHPVELHIAVPDRSSRGLALATLLFMIVKVILALPHIVVMYFLGIAAFIVGFAAQVVVLFTGKYPPQLHNFVVGVMRWNVRVNAYVSGLRDEYPPFKLEN
jgi:hypothetical protein